MKSNSPSSRDGFVLVAVIWLAGLIAVMATEFIAKVRIDTIVHANAGQALRAEYMADGLARLLAWKLAKGEATNADGRLQFCRWTDGPVAEYAIQDQAGLADLNAMPIGFFARLFEAAGADARQTQTLSKVLGDFRDADDVAQDGGSEASAYAGLRYGPKNAPFEAAEELDQLPGMTEQLYRKVLPVVTVHSAQPGIDATAAPRTLRELFNEPDTGGFSGPLAPYAGAAQGRAYGIDVRVTLPSGGRFRRKAIFVLLRQPDRPFAVVSWMQGGDWDSSQRQQAAVQPCFN